MRSPRGFVGDVAVGTETSRVQLGRTRVDLACA